MLNLVHCNVSLKMFLVILLLIESGFNFSLTKGNRGIKECPSSLICCLQIEPRNEEGILRNLNTASFVLQEHLRFEEFCHMRNFLYFERFPLSC